MACRCEEGQCQSCEGVENQKQATGEEGLVSARRSGCYARKEEGCERRGREDVEKGKKRVNEAYFFVRNQREDCWNDDGGGGKLMGYFPRQWREVGV